MSLQRISTSYSSMDEINKRLASNEAKKARRLLETVMNASQAFKVVRTRITNDVLSGTPTTFAKIDDSYR